MPQPFQPFALGDVMANAQQLSDAKENATFRTLQRQYLGQRMTQDAAASQRDATQFDQQQKVFDQQQQLSTTKLLNMAAAEVAANPQAAKRWDPILKSAIPGWSPADGPPEQIQASAKALFESTSKALQAYQAASQNNSDIPSNVREYSFYNSLPPDKKKEFLEMKRSMNPYNVVDVAGGRGVIDRRSGDVRTLTTAEQEAGGQAKVAGATSEAKAEAEAVGKATGAMLSKAQNSANVDGILDIAEPLIDEATGSGTGASRDKLAAFFGVSTEGARAIAQLQPLQAAIMMNQPRMEGPQSDKDVELYRQAAGQLGDPGVPAATKKAAVSTIRALQQKYRQLGAPGTSSPRPSIPGAQQGAAQAGPIQVQSQQQYDAMPSGTQYLAPDGTTRTKR